MSASQSPQNVSQGEPGRGGPGAAGFGANEWLVDEMYQQYLADLSTNLGAPQWFDLPATRLGVRGTWRSLDRFSPRYCPTRVPDNATGALVCDPTAPAPRGDEWEIRTYLIAAW